MPAEADPGSTVVSGEGIELAAVGTTAQVVVKLEDKFGNPITDPGTSTVNVLFVNTVNSSATFPENSLPLELTWDPELEAFTMDYTTTTAGNFAAQVQAGGVLRSSTRPTLNRPTESASPCEHSS